MYCACQCDEKPDACHIRPQLSATDHTSRVPQIRAVLHVLRVHGNSKSHLAAWPFMKVCLNACWTCRSSVQQGACRSWTVGYIVYMFDVPSTGATTRSIDNCATRAGYIVGCQVRRTCRSYTGMRVLPHAPHRPMFRRRPLFVSLARPVTFPV